MCFSFRFSRFATRFLPFSPLKIKPPILTANTTPPATANPILATSTAYCHHHHHNHKTKLCLCCTLISNVSMMCLYKMK